MSKEPPPPGWVEVKCRVCGGAGEMPVRCSTSGSRWDRLPTAALLPVISPCLYCHGRQILMLEAVARMSGER